MTYFSAFPCLLGLTILLLQTIFVSKKKQWKMESTKQIRSIRSIRGQKSNPYSLPFREGPGVGFFPSRSTVNPQDGCFGCFKCFRCFRCFISLLDQKIARFWSKSKQNRCFKCFSCSKCSASTRSPNQARSATNQASLRAANQARSAANPQKRCFRFSSSRYA